MMGGHSPGAPHGAGHWRGGVEAQILSRTYLWKGEPQLGDGLGLPPSPQNPEAALTSRSSQIALGLAVNQTHS